MTAVAETTGAWLEHSPICRPRPPGCSPCARTPSGASPSSAFRPRIDEEWRFTNVAPIARTTFAPGRKGEVAASWSTGPVQLVFANGHLLTRPKSLPNGLQVGDSRTIRRSASRNWASMLLLPRTLLCRVRHDFGKRLLNFVRDGRRQRPHGGVS